MRENALPILEASGVDLVLAGHSHSYERSYLLDGHYGTSDTLDPNTMILDNGDGNPDGDGAYSKTDLAHRGAVYAVAGSSGKTSNAPLNHPAMVISLKELGSMVMTLDGNRLDAVFLTDTGAIRYRRDRRCIHNHQKPLSRRSQQRRRRQHPRHASVPQPVGLRRPTGRLER